jgi:hypothetical protein
MRNGASSYNGEGIIRISNVSGQVVTALSIKNQISNIENQKLV